VILMDNKLNDIIKVIGVGGGGGNAVNYMFHQGITGVDFYICNTDAQSLEASPVLNKIHLGSSLTQGRGAGSNPEVGKMAAEESLDAIAEALGVQTQMVFITAGMGGGTGTGAAPVIARAARDLGILTVGIVTTPFMFEGGKRSKQAEEGIAEMRKHVDSLLVISNDRIKEIYGNLPISKAFSHADNVLTIAARGIAEIITLAGIINVDFEDVKTAMKGSGVSIMGSGSAEGPDRAMRAAELALNSPLLNDSRIDGASDLLINISYGEEEATMDEYWLINEYFQKQAGMDANLKCGLNHLPELGQKISITVIATGFNKSENEIRRPELTIEAANDEQESESIPEIEKRQISIFDQLAEEAVISAPKQKVQTEDAVERLRKIRDLKQRSMDQEHMEEIEHVPAYKRKGVFLEEVPHSSETGLSRYALVDEPEKKPELRSGNSFLHDNVD
jgi:cell division protein FtsZ